MSRLAPAATALLLVIAALAAIGGFVFLYLTWSVPAGNVLNNPGAGLLFLVAAVSFGLVGALISFSRPDNRIGWLLLVMSILGSLDILLGRHLAYVLIVEPDSSLPRLRETASLLETTWIAPAACLLLLLILFPSGRPASRTMTVVSYLIPCLSIAVLVTQAVTRATIPAPFEAVPNLLYLEGASSLASLATVFTLGFALTGIAIAVDIVRRLRNSEGDEREQFKWFAYVAAWIPLLTLLYLIVAVLDADSIHYVDAIFPVFLTVIPVAIGVAILKYRLYDIDILINRTLVYVPLTAIVIGLYTALIGLFKTIATEVTDSNTDAAVAITTLLIVVLLTPLKNQLQAIVDRYFKEEKHPAAEVDRIARQASAILEVVDVDAFSRRMLDDLTRVLGAGGARLEFNDGSLPLTSGDSEGPWAISVSVTHDGRELGALSLSPRRDGRPYNDAERNAVEGAAMVLAHGLCLDIRSRRATTV